MKILKKIYLILIMIHCSFFALAGLLFLIGMIINLYLTAEPDSNFSGLWYRKHGAGRFLYATEYINGEKDGIETIYRVCDSGFKCMVLQFGAQYTFEKGFLDGEYVCWIYDECIKGVYKGGKPYSGEFLLNPTLSFSKNYFSNEFGNIMNFLMSNESIECIEEAEGEELRCVIFKEGEVVGFRTILEAKVGE